MFRNYVNCTKPVECVSLAGNDSAHMIVQLTASDGSLVIFDPANSYYNHDYSGSIIFGSTMTTLEGFTDDWKLRTGDSIQVTRVFSDSGDIQFGSTAEYLGWMSSRT
jgi:hypothetical protein